MQAFHGCAAHLQPAMFTIYVFENARLGDNGDQFRAALEQAFTADTMEECLSWFSANYDINDYTSSFTAP